MGQEHALNTAKKSLRLQARFLHLTGRAGSLEAGLTGRHPGGASLREWKLESRAVASHPGLLSDRGGLRGATEN